MKQQVFYLIFVLIALSSCLESPEMTTGIVNGKKEPTVETGQISPVSNNDGQLVFHGAVTSKGKDEKIEKGFYWSTTSNNPGSGDNIALVADTTIGAFTYELNNVSGDTIYYWRAFARNSYGDDLGKVDSFRTPNIWDAKQEFPSDSRWRGAVFMLNNSIYTTCGMWAAGMPTDMWKYSVSSNLWSVSNSMAFIGDVRIYPVVFTIGNFAFVGTGQKAAQVAYNDLYRYDSSLENTTDSLWIKIATPDNFEARYEAVAFGLNGKGYIIGGLSSDGKELNDVWQYDPDKNSWQKKNNFPDNISGGISILGNNRAFAGFGDTSKNVGSLWEYDPATDSWNKFAELPEEETSKIYSGVIVQNTIYIIDKKNSIWALDMSNKIWKLKRSLPPTFLDEIEGSSAYQTLLTTDSSNSIYVGLGFTKLLYEYRPLWDN